MPIALRLPMISAALMVLIGVIASQLTLSALSRVENDRLRDLARLHLAGMSLALGPHVLRGDVWEAFDVIDRAVGQTPRVSQVIVAGRDGRVLAASDPRTAPVDSPFPERTRGAVSLDELRVTGAEDRLKLLMPLDYQGRAVGQILTELDVADIRTGRQRLIGLMVVGNVLATGVLALAGYLLLWRALRPLAVLTRHMSRGGDRPAPIPVRATARMAGEIGELADSYNRLTEAVKAGAMAQQRLAERERMVSLGRLASGLAHEINNPLGGLLNATDTIRSYPDRPEVVRAAADLVHRGLGHLRDISRAALDHNRVSRNGRSFSADDLADLRLLIDPELRRLRQSVDWPESIDGTTVPSGLLRQVLLNLLLNAMSAAGPGGRIGLEWNSGRALEITVADDGPGLPEPAARRLVSPDGDAAPGSGVGLRLVRELVVELGGCIRVDRARGQTRITLVLRSP